MSRRGRERRAQCHAGAHASRLGLRVGIDDALIVVVGIDHHERARVARACAAPAAAAAARARRPTIRAARARAPPGRVPAPWAEAAPAAPVKRTASHSTQLRFRKNQSIGTRMHADCTHAAAAVQVRSMGSRLPPRLLMSVTRAPCRPARVMGSSSTRNMAGDASMRETLAAIQHAERTPLLGRELQPADGARAGARQPGQRHFAGAGAQRLLMRPQRQVRAHHEHAIERHAMRLERRREGLVRRRHPGAPARRRGARQRRQHGQQ